MYIALNMVLYDALYIALSKLCYRHILKQTRIKRKTEVKHEDEVGSWVGKSSVKRYILCADLKEERLCVLEGSEFQRESNNII